MNTSRNQRRVLSDEELRSEGRRLVESALTAPDSDELIEEGRWAGFTRGRAIAWSWNLFQYEPTGFVHPNSEVRFIALKKLENGGIPAVFGYPERAREHEARGLTPLQYREYRDALGTRIHPEAVRPLR